MADPKPPFVRFEARPVEDRTASQEAGHYVYKDVVYALITPAGTKDCIEKVAEDWLRDTEEGVRQERLPQSWLDAWKFAYKSWVENREIPVNGIPLDAWPAISPAQHKNCLDANIRTVEELAEATEEGLSRLGMGARALKEKAKAYLETSADTGKVSEELAAMRNQIDALLTRDKEREEELKKLVAENAKLTTALEKEKA